MAIEELTPSRPEGCDSRSDSACSVSSISETMRARRSYVHLTFRRQPELAGGTVDQPHAELPLDARHQLADRGGARLHGTRGGRKAARVDDLHERLDAARPVHQPLR